VGTVIGQILLALARGIDQVCQNLKQAQGVVLRKCRLRAIKSDCAKGQNLPK